MKNESLVKKTLEMHEDMNALTVDAIEKMAPKVEVEPQIKLTAKQMAESEGALYIEPRRKLPPFGKISEELKKKRDYDWEYVKGIYENYVVNGETLRFWYCIYPGDPDCEWEIPANRPVYVPRMIAKHLEECQKYHTFDYVERPGASWKKDDFTHAFTPTGTHYRGKFRPIGAFA